MASHLRYLRRGGGRLRWCLGRDRSQLGRLSHRHFRISSDVGRDVPRIWFLRLLFLLIVSSDVSRLQAFDVTGEHFARALFSLSLGVTVSRAD